MVPYEQPAAFLAALTGFLARHKDVASARGDGGRQINLAT
jgi:hypothetical protein